jgi:response regulator RpfG family c-di-GMP phosphodiesterase
MIGEILLDNDMEKDDLHTAALLHDIGLVFIEPHLRTNVEIYQRHSSIGADLLKKIAPWRNASIIVQHHHENYNGTGYPEGLSGEDIPLPSKILAVAEYYDYLINDSFESQSLKPEEAKFEIINCSGTYFDPKVVEVFAQVFDHINKAEK